MTRSKIIFLEAAGASLFVSAVTAIASPQDVWLAGWGLHPMWLVIIVLAARYATAGLFTSLGIGVAMLAGATMITGGGFEGSAAHVREPADLLALTTAVIVAWIAMLHDTRLDKLEQRLADAELARRDAEDNVHALHASLHYLRTRHDRLDIAIGLWRNIASRLERGDAQEAARAALELCEIRAGARAGGVLMRHGARAVTLAWRGTWSATDLGAHDLGADATVRAAIASGQVTPACAGATEHDCDVAVPVTDDVTGEVIAVIALRGVSPTRMHAAELRDLGVIGQWLAPAIARHVPVARPVSTQSGGRA